MARNDIWASIVIVTHNRFQLLESCLRSIRSQKPSGVEVIIVVNGVDSKTKSFLESFNCDKLNYYNISKSTPASARNFALKFCCGQYVCFLDDDTVLPQGYFSRVKNYLDHNPATDVLGGPDKTPPRSSFVERSIGSTLMSPFAMGGTFRRHYSYGHRPRSAGEGALILCNLWCTRKIFCDDKIFFPETFVRNEENVFIQVLSKMNKTIIYHPNIFVYHLRKKNLVILGRAIFNSGYFRAKMIAKCPFDLSLVPYLLPLGLFVTLILLILFSISVQALVAIYLVIILISSFVVSSKDFYFPLSFCLILFFHIFIHACYALGQFAYINQCIVGFSSTRLSSSKS